MTASAHVLDLRPGAMPLSALRFPLAGPVQPLLDAESRQAVDASRATVQNIVDAKQVAYGINTGFGLLAHTSIPTEQLTQLQTNLVLSHSTGVGQPLDDNVVRLVLVLKILSLSRGHSGIRPMVIDALLKLLEHDILPVIPSKGSVGASGDLAPLAHMSAVLLGEGRARQNGKEFSAKEALSLAGLEPIELGPKEGLALLNGTQVSTALALKGLFEAERLMAGALVTGAMSVDAMQGSDVPFDPRIQAVRGQPGQIDVAAIYRSLLEGSEIRVSHEDCDRVQDPYSLRCQPQVMGAALDLIRNSARTLHIEANAVTDNPLIFADAGDVLSGGNFHAEPVAMASDVLAIAMAEIGSLSERRLALLVDPNMSGLPAFLVQNSGVNSGFMIVQVTSAALVSENKSLAHPASIDSLPTSANQEDHVSMATFAARRLSDMAANGRDLLACELIAAAQGIDLRRPLKTSKRILQLHDAVRQQVAFYEEDRYLAPDIAAASDLLAQDLCRDIVAEIDDDLLPSLT